MNKLVFDDIKYASQKELEEYSIKGRLLSQKYFGKTLKVYYPSKKFPSISITGASCALNCLHCNKRYLKSMQHITTPKELELFALNLEKKHGRGFLLSGGYNEDSIVPLDPYLDTITKIKAETKLKINVHPGLVDLKQAKALAKSNVDVISFDLITHDEVISKVIKNNKKGNDYINSFESLIKAGLNVVPHICLGLYFGDEKGNIDAVETALKYDIPLIVFLGLIPTKGTPMEKITSINTDFLLKLILYTRLKKPKLEQALGCMRERVIELEQAAILGGINRIAVPKKELLDFATNNLGLTVKQVDSCCSI